MPRPMKHSGVEWLGEIPADWNISRLKYVGNYVNGYAFKPEQWGDKGKLIIRIQDLTGSNNKPNYYDGEIDQKYYVKKGDILVSWAATLDAFIWNKGEGLLNQHIFKANNNGELVEYNFFFYLLKVAMEYMNNDNKHGIMMQHVTLNVFGNFIVAFPPLDEQQRIATFLDGECARIDSVIEKTRASIVEYKKLKQAIITRAVTKGMRPARLMKDSGVEWLGDIPADWSMCRLRFLCDILTGNQDTQDNDPNGEYPFYVRSPIVERSNKYTFEGDAILMAGDGVGAGKVFHYVSGKYGCHQRVYSLQNIRGIARRFLYYYLQNRFYVSIETANSKSTVDSVRLIMLKNFPILIPPLEEQEEIAQYLDEKTAAIDSLVAKKIGSQRS